MHPYRDAPPRDEARDRDRGDDRAVHVAMAIVGAVLLLAGGPIGLTVGGLLVAVAVARRRCSL
jgi:hypothetical protein